MRFRSILTMFALAALGAACLAVPAARHKLASLGTRARAAAGEPADAALQTLAQAAPPWPVLRAPDRPVKVPDGISLTGWSIMDRHTKELVDHSERADTARNDVESMIKPWIATDYLTRLTKANRKPTAQELADLRKMIIRSDDQLADHFAHATVGKLSGYDAVRTGLDDVCGLRTGSNNYQKWSYTTMTAWTAPNDDWRHATNLAQGADACKAIAAQFVFTPSS
jgi:hypothetical protein